LSPTASNKNSEKLPAVSTGQKIAGIIGGLAFLIGFILALLSGFIWRDNGGIILTLVVLGLVVAVLNITAREVVTVMVAAIALIVAGNLSAFTPLDKLINGFGTSLNDIVNYLAVFMVPVAIISAVRAVIATARPGD
jgi:hypothetical protein